MNCCTGMYLILDVLISLSGLPFLFLKCWCDFVSSISMVLSIGHTAFASKPKLLQKYIRYMMKVLKIVLNRKISVFGRGEGMVVRKNVAITCIPSYFLRRNSKPQWSLCVTQHLSQETKNHILFSSSRFQTCPTSCPTTLMKHSPPCSWLIQSYGHNNYCS